ncbi:MAG: hypothetical protein RL367_405 [Pseudomonadota bacterium]|jgi:hypothetical protein
MAIPDTGQQHPRVPLTRFHNNTGECLDLATRTPVVLTSHGRERHILLDSVYFHRLEAIARGNILAALGLEVHATADMPADLRAHILATQPSDAEIASGKWNDD